MNHIRTNRFEGWYFHHQIGDTTLSFIPGHTKGEAFLQVNANSQSYLYPISNLSITRGHILADQCTFSRKGCRIALPDINGQILYRNLTPLRSDIMGPFQYLPMQCRHGVISMHHSLLGSISIHGEKTDFTNGNGYIELDCGTSFPQSYLWLQCNDFTEKCALMVSLAHIPFCGSSFTGCICAIIYKGLEYRLATYRCVQILAYQKDHITLLQGKLLLDIDIVPSNDGHPLRSPVKGSMKGTIHESNNATIHVRLWKNGKQILHLISNHAMYEYVSSR